MARKSAISPGISTTTIQAPCVNLVVAMMSMTRPVAAAPTPFSSARPGQPGPRVRSQYRTMLDCESVNETNTPTA